MKLSSVDITYTKKLLQTDKAENAVQAAKVLSNVVITFFSPQTLRRGSKKSGWRAVIKEKQPLLKSYHKKAKLVFAERYKEWTVEDWKRVWFSDETKINRLGLDRRKFVWKEARESLSDRLVEGTVKFGGENIMIWGCMNWEGIGFACRNEGKINGELYREILKNELMNSLD